MRAFPFLAAAGLLLAVGCSSTTNTGGGFFLADGKGSDISLATDGTTTVGGGDSSAGDGTGSGDAGCLAIAKEITVATRITVVPIPRNNGGVEACNMSP